MASRKFDDPGRRSFLGRMASGVDQPESGIARNSMDSQKPRAMEVALGYKLAVGQLVVDPQDQDQVGQV